MRLEEFLSRRISRRTAAGLLASATSGVLLSACRISRDDDDDDEVTADDDLEQEDEDDAEQDPDEEDPDEDDDEVDDSDDDADPAPDPPVDDDSDDVDDSEVAVDDPEDDAPEPRYEEDPDVNVISGSVIDYRLDPDGMWEGPFGSVTLHLHRGWVDGNDLTYIRTDASDLDFAQQHGLVHSPLLRNALDVPESHGTVYLFEGGPPGQIPVFNVSPDDADRYTGAFRVVTVMVAGKTATPIYSESEILEAEEVGNVVLFESETIVNYPHITWSGGQIPVDADLVEAIGGGQLIEEPDLEGREVTFKLHRSAPGNRFIITSTSDPDSDAAQSSAVAASAEMLDASGSTAEIYVFANGVDGAGLMGHQHEIASAQPGDEGWSPFMSMQTVDWAEEADFQHVDDVDELNDLADAGELEIIAGAPGTGTDLVVLNCPVPLLASVDMEPEE